MDIVRDLLMHHPLSMMAGLMLVLIWTVGANIAIRRWR